MFVGLFAFDSFNESIPFLQSLGGFLIHLLPVYVLVALLLFVWRWEWIVTAGAFVLALSYVLITRGGEHWSASVVIITPLAIIGVLFYIGWRMQRGKLPHRRRTESD